MRVNRLHVYRRSGMSVAKARVILSMLTVTLAVVTPSCYLDMLCMTFPDTIDIIGQIVNLSIETSTFPDVWKTALVRPLPKNSSPSELNDLRPISILPLLSKIQEKAVSIQLTEYLERSDILPKVQSGFRKGRGTVTALLDITDSILCAQDQGMCTVVVTLDYSRAFDSINLDLLLSKMHYYGFDIKTIKWFSSYVADRHQQVKLSDADGSVTVSDLLTVDRGVPQGSILGPILFILYTTDITTHIRHCKYHMYADDIQLYISCYPSDIDSAIMRINEDLQSIEEWSSSNSLVLNPNKTKYIVFGSKQQLQNVHPTVNIKLSGHIVERVFMVKNLGLLMDPCLRFENHIAHAVRDCFYRLKVLYKARPFLKESLRVQLVEALILSKLNYADVVVGPRLLGRTKRLLQRIQHSCARFCFDVPPRAHVTPFLNKHSLLKMKHRMKLHLACLMFGVVQHQAPSYLYNKLSWVSNIKRRGEVRNCSIQLVTQHHRTAAFKGSFRYAASKCWNNIPPPIRDLRDILAV